MFSTRRWCCLLFLSLLGGCSRPSCCVQKGEEEQYAPPSDPADDKPADPSTVSMLGGTINRNMANTTEKGIVATWSIEKGKEKNVKWVAKLGNYSYGGPVVAGGRVFVGTNNEEPRTRPSRATRAC